MKRIFNFFWKQKIIIIPVCIYVLITEIFFDDKEDIILLYSLVIGAVIFTVIMIWAFNRDRKYKLIRSKYGDEIINMVEEFILLIANNSINDIEELYTYVSDNGYSFLYGAKKLKYSKSICQKEVKKQLKIRPKDERVQLAIKIINFIFSIYEDNGKIRNK